MSKRNIARNAPCHCGSGLKYKRCHGKGYLDRPLNASLIVGLVLAFGILLVLALEFSGVRTSTAGRSVTQYTQIPGIRIELLQLEKRSRYLDRMNQTPCTCDCKMTVAECRNRHSTCEHSQGIAEASFRRLKDDRMPGPGSRPKSSH